MAVFDRCREHDKYLKLYEKVDYEFNDNEEFSLLSTAERQYRFKRIQENRHYRACQKLSQLPDL